jgi:hypothetical protein
VVQVRIEGELNHVILVPFLFLVSLAKEKNELKQKKLK